MLYPHPESESQEFEQHLHGEQPGEHHVQDVHDVAEALGLFIMLRDKRTVRSETLGHRHTWYPLGPDDP